MSRRFAFLNHRLFIVSLACSFLVIITFLWLIQSSIQSFKREDIESTMKWMSESVIYFCSSSEDQLSQTGQANDRIQLYLKQAETLEFVENYVNNNGYQLVVVDQSEEREMVVLDSFNKEGDSNIQLLTELTLYDFHEITIDGVRFDVFVTSFDPWKWKMLFYKGHGSFDNLLSKIMIIYIIFGILIGSVALLVLLFLKQLTSAQRMMRESEFGMKATLNALAEGVVVLDEQGGVLRINPAAFELIACASGVRAVGRHAYDLFRLKSNDTGKPISKEGLEDGGSAGLNQAKTEEYTLLDSSNNSKTVRLSGASFKHEQGGKTQQLLVLSFYDITHLKKTEKLLQQAQRMETVGLMAGGVAHDLNNILSGVVTYPQLLLQDMEEDSPMKRALQMILDSGRQAASVVDDLLTVARGAASSRGIANLNNLIEDYLALPEHQTRKLEHSRVEIVTELERHLPNISCSSVHVNKCLMNLILNALESLKNESGRCVISTQTRHVDRKMATLVGVKKGKYAVVVVQDDGEGISAEDMQHIFEPFYTKKKMGKSGTGLGLSVVWNTMHDHNGGVAVESDENGTKFSLYFPVTTKPITEVLQKGQLAEINGNEEIILVVDDDERQLEITSEVLKALNYTPICVNTGESALEYLMENDAAVLVLDMVMEPGISGYETYREVISFKPEQKAIVVSGYSRSEDVVNTLELGADTFVKKPYSMEQLGMALKKVL